VQLLVLDAYARDGREALRGAGATEAGPLYAALLGRLAPAARVDVAHVADGPLEVPDGRDLEGYDGVVWTGSSLTIHAADDVRVTRQIELAREIRTRRVRSFGSCWAAQVATVAAGGRCAAHPLGREFGVSRGITLSEAGQLHPMYQGKPLRFDALTSHADEVVALGPATTCLARNDWSAVQAVDVAEPDRHFWAVQYHPEYDLREVAALARLRGRELVAQGVFASGDLVDRLGLDAPVLDDDLRTLEVRNWLHSLGEGAAPGSRA